MKFMSHQVYESSKLYSVNYPSFRHNIDSKCTYGNLTVSHLKRYIFMVLAIAVFVIIFVAVISMIIAIFNKPAVMEAANSSCNEYIRSNISSLQNECLHL